jgi:hypothetical protein
MKRLVFGGVTLLVILIAAAGILEFALRHQSRIQLSGFKPFDSSLAAKRYQLSSSSEPPEAPAQLFGGCREAATRVKILSLGDSWIEDGGIQRGFGEELASRGKCIESINGGTTSYAPSPITIKGELLIRKHRPDYVLVNIDETDLMDEWTRYRRSAIRDSMGRLVEIHYEPNVTIPEILAAGFVVLERHDSYILRLVEKIYHTRVFASRIYDLYTTVPHENSYQVLMSPQVSPDPERSHAHAFANFRQVFEEMLDRLAAAGVQSGHLVVSHHPHRLGIEHRYNNALEKLLRASCLRKNVSFCEADPAELYAKADLAMFFRTDDAFSHLNDEGYVRYGRFIARRCLPM